VIDDGAPARACPCLRLGVAGEERPNAAIVAGRRVQEVDAYDRCRGVLNARPRQPGLRDFQR